MSDFYDDMAATAAELLTTDGQPVTIAAAGDVSASGTYDPTTGKVTSAAPATQAVMGVEEAYSAFHVNGTSILAGDKKLHVSPVAIDGTATRKPAVDDTVTFADASVWLVKKADPIAPAGTPVLFTLQLRATQQAA